MNKKKEREEKEFERGKGKGKEQERKKNEKAIITVKYTLNQCDTNIEYKMMIKKYNKITSKKLNSSTDFFF